MDEHNGKPSPLTIAPPPSRVRCSTSYTLEQLPSGRRQVKVFLMAEMGGSPHVIAELEVLFQDVEHARILAMGLGRVLSGLPAGIVRPG